MIGIFDSGMGGLSVLKALRTLMPGADIVYFGDIKNAPYGEKPLDELSVLTADAIRLLQNRGATHIVSACNSVSASLALSLFDSLSLEPQNLVEMVGPTVAHFRDSDKKLALCATPATIRSGIYQNAFRMFGKELIYIPVPELAGAIEFGTSESDIEKIIRDSVPAERNFDTLILSCTHYPLVRHSFEKVLGPEVNIFDPSSVVATRAHKAFREREHGEGTMLFVLSKDSEYFRNRVQDICLPGTYTIDVIDS